MPSRSGTSSPRTTALSSRNDPLWTRLLADGQLRYRFLQGFGGSVALSDLAGASSLSENHDRLRGRSVLIATQDQLTAALALLELDGIAGRLVLCPPNRSMAEIRSIAIDAEADALIVDEASQNYGSTSVGTVVECSPNPKPFDAPRERRRSTEWILLTSGITAAPKLVVHSLASLAGAAHNANAPWRNAVWSSFCDIRRYAGLQTLLRALLSGGSLVLSDPEEPIRDFLRRASASGVTHITGTPSHWRRVLMSGSAHLISPSFICLSGEIVDQPLLDSLRASYPAAEIADAFASTEAGPAFEVTDGRAGFPESVISQQCTDIEIMLEGDSLLVRSSLTGTRYLNHELDPLRREDGFVDTQDMVDLRDGRYHFIGRREGTINVGGLKCHPEEIESIINRHPMVQMSLVRARKSAQLGSVLVADVVLNPDAELVPHGVARDAVSNEIIESCRRLLSAHKVPASIRIVTALDVAPSGKLQRPNA
jgi:acyl-coenzyme A synthetase/AMP-(fatty) acid ligase